MNIGYNTTLTQLLKDAGCSPDMIDQFLLSQQNGLTAHSLRLLRKHRQQLITVIHRDQKQLDALDLLIYTIKKQEKEC